MAINYIVLARVVDITADAPKAEDSFLVDTNVWYWLTYSSAISNIQSNLSNYPQYLKGALDIKSTIHYSGLTFAELSHIIEKTEREIYSQSVATVETKEYRHNLANERARVVSEINAAWGQVSSLATALPITIDVTATDKALNRMKTEKLDGYDLFILESMSSHGVVKVLTDDGDFATVSGIQVFTANRNVIQAAKSQGRLIKR